MRSSKIKIISAIAVAVLLVLATFPMISLGWFSSTDTPQVGAVGMEVVKSSTSDISLTFSPSFDGEKVEISALFPGNTEVLWIRLKNTSLESMEYTIELESVLVEYPTKDLGYKYQENIINANDYYNHLNRKIEVERIAEYLYNDKTKTENVFNQFVSPISNAVCFSLNEVVIDKNQSLSDQLEMAEEEVVSNLNIEELSYITTEKIKTNDKKDEFLLNTKLNGENKIVIDGEEEKYFYMILHFNGEKYQSRTLAEGEKSMQIELKNSNPYIMQDLTLNLKLVENGL